MKIIEHLFFESVALQLYSHPFGQPIPRLLDGNHLVNQNRWLVHAEVHTSSDKDDCVLSQALGACGAHVVLLDDFQRRSSDETRKKSQRSIGQTYRRQNHVPKSIQPITNETEIPRVDSLQPVDRKEL